MWEVEVETNAQRELDELPARERAALGQVINKLKVDGPSLGAPHTSSIVGASGTLRELRPRQGRSRWRGFYRRIGDTLVIGAFGPEAQVDSRGFDRAVRRAIDRLDAWATTRGIST